VAVSVIDVTQGAITTSTTTVTLDVSGWSNTPTTGDFVVLLYRSYSGRVASSGSGLGGTWVNKYASGSIGSLWVASGATSKGTISITQNAAGIAQMTAYLVRGLPDGATVSGQFASGAGATEFGPTAITAGNEQIAFSWMVGLDATLGAITYPMTETPSGGWTYTTAISSATQYARSAYRIPTDATTNHRVTGIGATGDTKQIFQAVIGTYTAPSSDVTVAAPVLAVAEDVKDPTVVAGATATVAAPTLAVAADVKDPTVSAGHGVTVGAPALALVAALLAPTVSAPANITVSAPALAVTVAVPSPNVVTASGVVVIAPTLGLATAIPAPSVTAETGSDSVTVAAPATSLAFDVLTPTITGATPDTSDAPTVALCYAPMGARAIIPLVTVEDLPQVEPIMRRSVLMEPLSAEHPVHARRECLEGDDAVVSEVIGRLQMWIGGRNITYLRGVPIVARRWESESPIGDTVASFEFPQLNPWDKPGDGDLDFLYPDAPVAIGLKREVSPGVYRVQRLWNGYLDARGNGLVGEGEDYAHEAKGTLTAALHAVHEPRPFTEPTDIWVLIARALNAVPGRRWAYIPQTPIGIKTLTRGSRDDFVWDYVQQLLSEAITDDGRQWTINEVAPGVIRPVLKPAPSTVHATVSYGTPGVDIDFRIDESTRVDGFFVSGIAPNGGGWANVFYPGVELLNPPPYPNSDTTDYLNLGTTDADTDSGTGVTDWQRRVKEIAAFSTPAVSGVMSSAWIAVVDDVQRFVGVTADSSVGPQTWNAVFDRVAAGSDFTPIRLPLAVKPWAWPFKYTAAGVKTGPNPLFDKTRVPRFVPLQLGARKTKREGAKIARALLGVYGEAGAYGQIRWEYDPNETDRAMLSHLSNVKVRGFEGEDRVVQVAHKVVSLDESEDGPVYVVTTDVDEHARDAMWVEDLLEQRRNAQPDLSRRPTGGGKSSRVVVDERTPWDAESPCGVLRRTAVNGSSGLWSVVTVPFAEIGKLAGIRLTSDQPFAMAIFASLRITENKLASIVGNPFASSDPWRDVKGQLDEYGIIEAWGEEGNACGYSPKTEDDDAPFTGLFELDTPVDYWTETVPYVSVAIFMRGGSGWIEGEFIPAYEGS
jgi:hypothetical protein